MAYIINNEGSSGYTRADFLSALEGFQPLLVSETNIKTINGNSVLGSGNIDVVPQVYPQENSLNNIEKKLRRKVKAYFDGGTYDQSTWEEVPAGTANSVTITAINPKDENTGKRPYFTFAFLTDLHTMPTNATISAKDSSTMEADIQSMLDAGIAFPDWQGDGNVSDASTIAQYIKSSWPSSDASYYGYSAEGSIRLAGAIAHAVGINAVVCGGDYSSGRLNKVCYRYELGQIKKMFDKYVGCERYIVDGNHDRKYIEGNVEHPQFLTNADWQSFVRYFNYGTPTYINDLLSYPSNKPPINTYFSDFNDHKVRLVFRSAYDESNGRNEYDNLFDCFKFSSEEEMKKWSVCLFMHHQANDDMRRACAFLNGGYYVSGVGQRYINGVNDSAKGLGSFGQIEGHLHLSYYATDGTPTMHRIKENMCHSLSLNSESDYCVSVFVFDTEHWIMHHLRLGKYNENQRTNDGYYITYNIAHNSFNS